MATWAEEQPATVTAVDASPADAVDGSAADYISASLLVIEPSYEVYSLVGHCALRLECPSKQMDYCFTFETSTDSRGLLRFIMGTAKGGFMASKTSDYLQAYSEAGRGVTAYPLNLTPQEELLLWQTADAEIARGFCHPYGYMHTQCTSMVVSLLSRALHGDIVYHESAEANAATFRDVMLTAADRYPWSTFFWQFIMGPEGDDTTPLTDKLSPQTLPGAWQRATIGGATSERHIVDGPAQPLGLSKNASEPCNDVTLGSVTHYPTPLTVFTILFIIIVAITLGQYKLGWRLLPRITDAMLLTAHTLTSLFLGWLVLFSRQEGTSWNWYLIVFNLLPLVLWLFLPAWRMQILAGTLALVTLQLLLTPLIPQLDLPHGMATACLAPRLALPLLGRCQHVKRQ